MTKVKPNDLASCDAEGCDIVSLRSSMKICSEVLLQPRSDKGKDGKTVYEGVNRYLDFCPGHAPSWTSHTNTSGYDRYYLIYNIVLGKAPIGPAIEVTKEGIPI